ncbi:MAG: type 1 glutamine amidotransferase [Planctomycetes bacterium]|nr:type 1 glutamine amidotransferase [Planctomycetota bacterium]
MRVLAFRHIDIEGPGLLEAALAERDIELTVLDAWRDIDQVQTVANFDGLLLLGGPMNVANEGDFPFMAPEKRLIREALDRRMGCVGICLGAQLLAEALGARVASGRHAEIGWMPLELRKGEPAAAAFWGDLPSPASAFHWHGQAFGLPEGATALASTEATEHQAFLLGGRVLGTQFHFEVTAEMARGWAAAYRGELRERCVNPSGVLEGCARHAEAYALLSRHLGERVARLFLDNRANIDRSVKEVSREPSRLPAHEEARAAAHRSWQYPP